MGEKVVLGLSGGVDSAVAAHLLLKRGFEVFGLYLDIGGEGSREDAKSVAEKLGVTIKISDIAEALEEKVCRPFVEAYLRGETPNPCILCWNTQTLLALNISQQDITLEQSTVIYIKAGRITTRAICFRG